MGPDDGIEWAYIPHLYYKYYVFSYATGLAAGIALAERVQRGGPQARDAYLGLLKGGSSRPPLELLQSAGVDLRAPHVIEAAARVMDRTLDEMEQILGFSRRQAAPSLSPRKARTPDPEEAREERQGPCLRGPCAVCPFEPQIWYSPVPEVRSS